MLVALMVRGLPDESEVGRRMGSSYVGEDDRTCAPSRRPCPCCCSCSCSCWCWCWRLCCSMASECGTNGDDDDGGGGGGGDTDVVMLRRATGCWEAATLLLACSWRWSCWSGRFTWLVRWGTVVLLPPLLLLPLPECTAEAATTLDPDNGPRGVTPGRSPLRMPGFAGLA